MSTAMTEAEEKAKIAQLLDIELAGRPLFDPSVGAASRASEGETLTITGVATNAALGAVVVDGGATYVGDLKSWPADIHGKQVSVTGKLSKRSMAPNPVPGPNGEQNHGAWGEQSLLIDATWELVK